MGLHLPPSVSVKRFVGGYRSISDFTDLSDTETNDAQNVVYGPNGDIDQRAGSLRLLPTKLFNESATATGVPITGHYWYKKSAQTTGVHIVTAGNSVYRYSSATASSFLTITDNSAVFWDFAQIIDPRDASDDIVLGTNGVDAIFAYNGSGTAVALSSFGSASGVPICKYITSHKNKVYAANIIDSSDADSEVTVKVSSFGSDGAPDPHRFLDEFVVGGVGRQGPITGIEVLNDQIVIYTKNSIWKFAPGAGATLSTASLIEIQEGLGCLAPGSLVNTGNFHIFLSERGVYSYDGVNFTHLSKDVDDELLVNSNKATLNLSKSVYDNVKNTYKIYFPFESSTRNNRALALDLRISGWQPPVVDRFVSVISKFEDSDEIEKIIYGDYLGYLYEDDRGTNDGIDTGFNGTVESASINTLTDSDANFTTANDGLSGFIVKIIEGTGDGQTRVIQSNTSAVLTLDSNWTQTPDTSSEYMVGGIDAFWRSKDYEFGNHDLVKLFRTVRPRVRSEGNFNLCLHYIVDFKSISQATKAQISLLDEGLVWNVGRWNQEIWASKNTVLKKINLRSTSNQATQGNHLALRFSNRNANQSFRLNGFDVEFKQIGKR